MSGPIQLRAVEPSDADLIHLWENDPEVWPLSGSVHPYSRKAINDFISTSHHDIYIDRQLRLMAVDAQGQTFGTIDLFDFCPVNQRAGVGILIDSTRRGQGLAVGVLNSLSTMAFGNLALRQLYCHIAVDNAPSLRAFINAGYKSVGTCKAWMRRGNTFIDAEFMQLLNPHRND
jgi:diamine N-acetyltransferase